MTDATFVQPQIGDPDLVMLAELRTMPYRTRIRRSTVEQLASHPELAIKPKIYIASKAHHRPQWRELRNKGYDIISQWIDINDKYSQDPTGLDYTKLWDACVQDVRKCDILILYVEKDEHLKGALVQLGVALGLGKEIIVTGIFGDDNGTWYHNEKIQVSNLAIEDLLKYVYGQES